MIASVCFEELFRDQAVRNNSFIRLPAANGLNIPYSGYFVTTVCLNNICVKNVIFVLKCSTADKQVPCIMRTNV